MRGHAELSESYWQGRFQELEAMVAGEEQGKGKRRASTPTPPPAPPQPEPEADKRPPGKGGGSETGPVPGADTPATGGAPGVARVEG
eukprot:2484032-Alexandrium_andersonii.AAC.1